MFRSRIETSLVPRRIIDGTRRRSNFPVNLRVRFLPPFVCEFVTDATAIVQLFDCLRFLSNPPER